VRGAEHYTLTCAQDVEEKGGASMKDTPPDEVTAPPAKKPRRPRPLKGTMRETRGALMLQRQLANHRIAEIQAEFRVSKATVSRAIAEAKRQGYLEKARDFLSEGLVPLALAAYEEALLHGDLLTKVDVANKVLDGLGITGKHATVTVGAGGDDVNFEQWRATVTKVSRTGHALAAGPAEDAASAESTVVDGEVTRPAETRASGDGNRDGRDDLSVS
jgi:hypothetical protein